MARRFLVRQSVDAALRLNHQRLGVPLRSTSTPDGKNGRARHSTAVHRSRTSRLSSAAPSLRVLVGVEQNASAAPAVMLRWSRRRPGAGRVVSQRSHRAFAA
jgi:hypothetical protein